MKKQGIEKFLKNGMHDVKEKVQITVLNQHWIHRKLVEKLLGISRDNRYVVAINFSNLKPIVNNRNAIVRDFLKTDNDYLMMIDSDVWPHKNPLDLIGRGVTVCPVIAVVKGDSNWVVFHKRDGVYWSLDIDHLQQTGKKWMEIDAGGTGCMIISREVLEAVKKPFEIVYDEDGVLEKGLDIYFCEKAKAGGFRIWAHCDYICSQWLTEDLYKIHRLTNRP